MESSALAVVANQGNTRVLSNVLCKMNIHTTSTNKLYEAHRLLDDEMFHIAIVDMTGYDCNVWDLCHKLKEKRIPTLIISSGNSKIKRKCYDHGACSVFYKPVAIKELTDCIKGLVLKK